MRNSLRSELAKLRELAHFLLTGRYCFFCGELLLTVVCGKVKHGDGAGPKLRDKITIHHIDGNHENDAEDNKALAHQSCHKRHHLALVRAAIRARKAA
jgi:hypothetical protein